MSNKPTYEELEQRIKQLEKVAIERERYAERLRQRESLHRAVTETSGEGFFIADAEGHLMEVNDAYIKRSGYSREDLLTMRISDLEAIETEEKTFERIKKIMEKGFDRFETKHQSKNGEIWSAEISISCWTAYEGRLFIFIHDITDRKQAEKALRESENKFRQVFDSSPIGKSITYASGEMHANNAFYQMLGYSPDEFSNLKWLDLTHPDDIKLSQSIFDSALSGEKDFNRFIKRYIHKNSSIVWVDVSAKLLMDDKGNPLYIISAITDITERKRAENALQESEGRLRSLINALPDLVWLKDLDGVYLACNARFEKFFGANEKDIIGKTDYDFMSKDLADSFRSYDKAAIEKGGQNINEEEITFAEDGHCEILETIKTPMHSTDGKLLGVLGIGRDITERKKMEETVIESERKWRNILINVPQIGITLDTKAMIIFANDYFLNVTGWERQEIIGQNWFDFFIPERVREGIRNVFQVAMSQKDSLGFSTYENEIMDRSGRLLNIAWSNVPTKDANGNVIDVTCLGVDITERRRSEKRLNDSAERLLEAQRIAKIGDFTWNIETGEVTWSEALYDLLKYDKSEKIDFSKVNSEIHHPDDLGSIIQWLNDCVASGQDHLTPNEYRIIRRDGEIIYVRTVGVIKREMGQAPIVFATVQNITERKRAENERERLLAAIEQTGDMVIITDTDGKVQFVNSAYESITGYAREDVIGQNSDIIDSDMQDRTFYSNIWDTITNGKVWKGQMVNKRKDGTHYTEDSTITPVKDATGRIVNFVSVKRDISEQLKVFEEKAILEEQLFQAQKMESVGRLAGGVAHDFNNMLGIIMGYAELAMDKLKPDKPLFDNLIKIYEAGKRSTDIVRQLLAFARKQTIAPKVIDLNNSIESMLKMLRRLLGEDIDIAWFPDADAWPVKIDPSQLDQILANLCVNARDAMKGVGKLTIETKNTVFDEEYCANHAGFVPGRFVLLAVSDTGHGIKPEILNNIFEPFFTTKDRDRGTGLGLSTVYGIVKQNDGFINVYSEPERGTTFKIYLPQHTVEIVDAHHEITQELPLSEDETILLVEDDASILKLSEIMLKTLGYNVLPANTISEAINLSKEHANDIELLITDVGVFPVSLHEK